MANAPLSPQVFWEQTEAELAELNPDVSLERDSFYSQPEWDVYRMRYTSTGGHRLSAWISVPKSAPDGGGPLPALVRMPDSPASTTSSTRPCAIVPW